MPGRLLSETRLWSGGEKPAGFSRVLRRELSGEGRQNKAASHLLPAPPAANAGKRQIFQDIPLWEEVAQGGVKASAFSKASASWEVGSDAEVCVRVTL